MERGLEIEYPGNKNKLQAQGIDVSVETIRRSVQFVNFNSLRKSLNLRYRRREDFECDGEPLVQIDRREGRFDIKLGPLHWSIDEQNRFGWVTLMYLLYKARDIDGKKVFSLTFLASHTVNNKQRLHQLFEAYQGLAAHYRDLGYVWQKRTADAQLAEQILDIWLEDVTLSAQAVADRLVELGVVESISVYKVCAAVRGVDFMKIRRRIIKDYKQGEYRKAIVWVMGKYQQIIADLLVQLEKGKPWSKAEVDKYKLGLPKTALTSSMNTVLAGLARCFAWLW